MSSSIRRPCASWRGWRASLGLLAVLAGCGEEQLAIGGPEEQGANDFGRSELMSAAATLAKTPESPAAYRDFVKTVETLRPRFNQRVADAAELRLTLMALGPLRAHATDSAEAQMQELATTVWPVALHVAPEDGESPADYVKRLCGGELAVECQHVVPEYWPEVLAAEVWRDLAERAREAVLRCERCRDPSYEKALAAYDDLEADAIARAQKAEEAGHPRQWPTAVGEPAPLEAELVLSIDEDGAVRLGDRPVAGDWRRVLRERRDGQDALAVHLEPDMTVGRLREVLADARAAGFGTVALIAREARFPYERLAYRLAATPASLRRVPLRDSDSIQLLVQYLGAPD